MPDGVAVARASPDEQPVGADAAVAVARARGRGRSSIGASPSRSSSDEEVVAEAVVLGERMRSMCPDRRHATFGELTQPTARARRSRLGSRSTSSQVMRGSRRNQRSWRRANRRVRGTASVDGLVERAARRARWVEQLPVAERLAGGARQPPAAARAGVDLVEEAGGQLRVVAARRCARRASSRASAAPTSADGVGG